MRVTQFAFYSTKLHSDFSFVTIRIEMQIYRKLPVFSSGEKVICSIECANVYQIAKLTASVKYEDTIAVTICVLTIPPPSEGSGLLNAVRP